MPKTLHGNKTAYGSLRFPNFCLQHDFVAVSAHVAFAGLLQLPQLPGLTTPTQTTTYDTYGNNVAAELLTNKEGFDLCLIGILPFFPKRSSSTTEGQSERAFVLAFGRIAHFPLIWKASERPILPL